MGDDEGDGGDEIFGVSKRKALITAGVAAALGVGAVALIGQVADYDQMLDALRRAEPVWFAAAGVGQLTAYGGYILGYHGIARAHDGPHFDYWTVTRVVGVGFGAYVVASAAGGLAVDFWALNRAGEDAHQAGRRVLGLNILQWATLATFAVVAGALVLVGLGGDVPLGMALGWLVVVPVCVALAYWFTQPPRGERIARLPTGEEPEERGRDVGRWARWLWVKVRKGFSDAIGGVLFVRRLIARPREAPEALAGYPIYWIGDLVTLYAALQAFGESVHPVALVLAYATGYVVTSAPLPAGAAGAAEATLAFSLTAVGVPLHAALLAVFVYRFYTFWIPIPIALAFLPTARSLHEELPRKGEEP